MAKIKFTKGELKRQRDYLEQFERYLPTLQLKKQQLQIKVLQMQRQLAKKEDELAQKEKGLLTWIGLLNDPRLPQDMDLSQWIVPEKIDIDTGNIAGAAIPEFKGARFRDMDYDLLTTPFWVDRGILALREYLEALATIEIIRRQIAIIQRELRVTTQRVNLFEKVKIPESIENIRRIRIYLGDQAANAVGISKVAKARLESVNV